LVNADYRPRNNKTTYKRCFESLLKKVVKSFSGTAATQLPFYSQFDG